MAIETGKAKETLGEFAAKRAIAGGLDLGYGALGQLAQTAFSEEGPIGSLLMGEEHAARKKEQREKDLLLIQAQIAKHQAERDKLAAEAVLFGKQAEHYQAEKIGVPKAKAEAAAAEAAARAAAAAAQSKQQADSRTEAARIRATADKVVAGKRAEGAETVETIRQEAAADRLAEQIARDQAESEARKTFESEQNRLDRESAEAIASMKAAGKGEDTSLFNQATSNLMSSTLRGLGEERQAVSKQLESSQTQLKNWARQAADSGMTLDDPQLASSVQEVKARIAAARARLDDLANSSSIARKHIDITRSWATKGWNRGTVVSFKFGGSEEQVPAGTALGKLQQALETHKANPDKVQQLFEIFMTAKFVQQF